MGDVLRDQWSHMRHCGFDCFVLREDKNSQDAIKSLQGISIIYGGTVVEPLPLYIPVIIEDAGIAKNFRSP